MTTEVKTTEIQPPRRHNPWVLASLAILAAGGLGVGIYLLFFQTYHYAVVKEGVLYRTGNRSMVQFSTTVRQVKPRTVVILVGDTEIDDEPFKTEVQYLQRKGIKTERIPVPFGKGVPTTDDVRRFLSIVQEPKNQPVLVHCAQGILRTGMMVAAYQESELGMTPEQAKAAVERFERSEGGRPVQMINRFIDNYDPARRVVKDPAKVVGADANAGAIAE